MISKIRKANIGFQRRGTLLFSGMLCLLLLLSGCASTVPVQEMSNARQSIQAAQQVNAQKLASDSLARAEALLESATRLLDRGEFDKARQLAMEAQQIAIRARNEAISHQPH